VKRIKSVLFLFELYLSFADKDHRSPQRKIIGLGQAVSDALIAAYN